MAKTKKFVYFLGAGASYGAGASAIVQAGGKIRIPMQSTFWETFLRFCKGKNNRKDIESFLFRYFLGYRKMPSRLSPNDRRKLLAHVDVEEVFTFLSERSRAPSTSAQLRAYSTKIWKALVAEIGHVFSRFDANVETRAIYRQLMSRHHRSFDTIVSFNYDTVFEQSLPHKRRACYRGLYKARGEVAVLKPHGSVNWNVARDGSIEVKNYPDAAVVIAPTHLKFVPSHSELELPSENQAGYLDQSDEIREIWSQMEQRMKDARALVFIGYSFPMADLYFSSVLRSVLADRDTSPDIVIVNPDAIAIAERLHKRFRLRKVVRYFDLMQFVQASRSDVIKQLES